MANDFIARLPFRFIKGIRGAFGEPGVRWLNELPSIIHEVEANWSIRTGPPFEDLSYHYVAPCLRSDGSEAVVKIGFPGERKYTLNEKRALQLFAGRAMVELFEFDPDLCAFLLERLMPGENLKVTFRRNESGAVATAVELLRTLNSEVQKDAGLPQLASWFDTLRAAETLGFAKDYALKALRIFEELSGDTATVFLHGDFHHTNILTATRAPFVLIDPKGVVGPIGYDIAVFLNNHRRWLQKNDRPETMLNDSARQFAEAFGLTITQVREWAYVQAVLSAWWTFEEGAALWRRELASADFWNV